MDDNAIPTHKELDVTFQSLPFGMQTAAANDMGETMGTIDNALKDIHARPSICRKVWVWLTSMGELTDKSTLKENADARFFRSLLLERLVDSPTDAETVDAIVRGLYGRYGAYLTRLPRKRAVAIIRCNFPVDEHTDGESVIGYRLLDSSEE